MAALTAAITGESLFTDEGYSAWLACHPTLGAMWHSLNQGDSSELQMLLYNVYLWCWVHLFGSGEYTMRLANLPFVALFVSALAITSRLVFRRPFAWMVVAVSPFPVFFVNEARAYSGMMACATACCGALLVYFWGESRYRRRAVWCCLLFLLLGLTLHMMMALLVPALAWIVIREGRGNWRGIWNDWRKPAAVMFPLIAVAGLYILWTIARRQDFDYGEHNRLEPLYNLYKLFGLWSLGPANSVLAGGAQVWATYVIPLLCGLALLGCALTGRLTSRSATLLGALGAGLVGSLAASIAAGFPLPARHLSAIVPVLLFFALVQARARWRLVCLTAVWLVASLRLAIVPEYGKDDYRSAVHAAIATAQRTGGEIIWAADPLTAGYYGLRLQDDLHPPVYYFDFNEGIRRVPWPVLAEGKLGSQLTPAQVTTMLALVKRSGKPAILVVPTRIPFSSVSFRAGAALTAPMQRTAWTPFIEGQQPTAVFQLLSIYTLK